MKKVGKILSLLLVTIIICASSANVMAYRNGDIIGSACYTDIYANINGYGIASYNVDGYTYVIAEDLRNYGFNVDWNSYSRTLSITRNGNYYPSTSYTPPFIAQSMVGKKSYNILYTDIVTYVNGNWVQSCNINGRTIIRFDSLNAFGNVIWTPESKEIRLEMSGLASKPVDITKYNLKSEYVSRAKQIEYDASYMINSAYTQYELNMVSYEIYQMWDGLLNEIYQYLKTTLPYSDFQKLQQDEHEWVNKKEAAADAEADMFYGGSIAPLIWNDVAAAYTKDRCYYLISLIKP